LKPPLKILKTIGEVSSHLTNDYNEFSTSVIIVLFFSQIDLYLTWGIEPVILHYALNQ